MAITWCNGSIASKTVWTQGLFTIQVDVPGVMPFEPGQFLQVGLEVDGQHVHRPYSVASPHGRQLEFYIVLVEDGQLTPHLWRMEAGDSIDVSQRAAGSFTLKKTPRAANLWLVATGTGLAPYIAMMRTGEPWDRYEKLVVVHGVRHLADLSYAKEMAAQMARHPDQLVYIPSVTRESSDGILTGRIPGCLESGALEELAQCEIRPDNTAIMLCGNPAMLDDMEALLGQRGLKRHRRKAPGQIVLERYW